MELADVQSCLSQMCDLRLQGFVELEQQNNLLVLRQLLLLCMQSFEHSNENHLAVLVTNL
jgi:hypothetical protein